MPHDQYFYPIWVLFDSETLSQRSSNHSSKKLVLENLFPAKSTAYRRNRKHRRRINTEIYIDNIFAQFFDRGHGMRADI